MAREYAQVEVESRDRWRAWLEANHHVSDGVWLVTFKKREGERHLPYETAVEEALCFGWIDSQARGLDEHRTQLLFTPRRSGSGWARTNKERVARLAAAGRMTPAGESAVAEAKADGSWTLLDDVENLVEPPELQAALGADPDARRHWDAFPPSAKRAILLWIQQAKRPATRERRIRETAERAAQDLRAGPARRD